MKIAIGLSGGVDSAVAALILKNAGHEVVGITLDLMENSGSLINDAKLVASFLGIEHHVADLKELFRKEIIEDFGREYLNGRTPNPCILCNEKIKFGAMLDIAHNLGCEKLATGHYADIKEENGRFSLLRADSPKDQSYFLYRLKESQLSKVIFPMKDYVKDETRKIALEAGIPVAQKKDSLEICFVPDDDYVSYLGNMGITSPAGNIINTKGEILGRHSGIINYTIGQRKGIGAWGKPMFVTEINAGNNTVTIGENGEQYGSGLMADEVTFIGGNIPEESFRADVKIRFRARPVPALITPVENMLKIEFDEPQRSITPGQAAVIYNENTVLGGGRIRSRI